MQNLGNNCLRVNQVSETSLQNSFTGFSRLKLFWALSRTPHGLLDMCTPAFGALLWLGHFPSLTVIVIGLITTFAGYTAVYALNDVIDYRVDKEKVAEVGLSDAGSDLDSVGVRHPMAQGLLSFKEGLLWATAWGFLALIGAYLLNPVCVLIFTGGCALEAVYCALWRVSPFRTFVSGAVKTSGAIAAVFAVDPTPEPMFVLLLFLMLFFWEIGGQNVPNDWSDLDEDRRMRAKTIPVRWGVQAANAIIVVTITLTLCMQVVIFYYSRGRYEFIYLLISIIITVYLLLLPALKLNKTRNKAQAMNLFNKASYFPLALLVVVVIKLLIEFVGF
jgi:4-hydroxybenzoate polyprenyltransferase